MDLFDQIPPFLDLFLHTGNSSVIQDYQLQDYFFSPLFALEKWIFHQAKFHPGHNLLRNVLCLTYKAFSDHKRRN